ncbi:hypothetical protein A2767_06135 [Candidatus Roizmanbacteria bacterium RIFCSPHIGHO2_01_FULL_35_10]|uniref:Uncharacterized protein n=1 Tax=Candidatus Roizmanbacteria bacterium RIFCSPLOWO2_01_FULL_35_13 TaxID=1802055 RepID=A0A1F7I7S6_9BACT|nr:MAG: hypothetical protein A2767_06135 [Candidatus Roizmanbacteria bacterium RIFCSPHIGHO2_01_FULL_35_10]OGK39332.1 MAG: hypothetical protein A3A74_05175 [Candidatus Roizmanbacteria bacterium RIFCSPLOWO2_01_FULL_35_13]
MHNQIITSVMSLFFQSGYSAVLGLIANLVLTVLLSPAVFGMYITVLSIISLLNYFSDIGLAASLIQKKEISDEDIKTTFTVQQILITILITIGFFSTSFIKKFYILPTEGIYLFWGLLLAFFISSLKTIPSIFLERKIQFQKIVQVQVIENTVFYLLSIILAILNFGVMSFTYAVIARAIVGLIAMYSISFWKPTLGVSIKSLKHLLSFGLLFQASSFLALFKDDLIILFLGKVLGFEALGYIGWAKKWAESPIRIIMDNISRVLFPVFSRIQGDKEKISRLLEKLLNYQTTLLAPTMVGLILLMEPLVNIIPRYNKWLPALPFFYIFCLSAFFSSYSTPFMNLFNALGKVKISFSFMLFWTVATWLLTPIFTRMFGLYGFPLNQLILSLTFAIVLYMAKKEVNFRFLHSVYKPLLATTPMGIITFLIVNSIVPTYPLLTLIILISALIYFITLKFIFKLDLIKEIKSIFLT